MKNWVFGCDVCQDVCPWNKFAHTTKEERFMARNFSGPGLESSGIVDTAVSEWLEIDIDEFRLRFRGSPVKRAKYEGLMRNLRIASKNAERG